MCEELTSRRFSKYLSFLIFCRKIKIDDEPIEETSIGSNLFIIIPNDMSKDSYEALPQKEEVDGEDHVCL